MEEAAGGTYYSNIIISKNIKYIKFKIWINKNSCVYKIIKYKGMKKEWDWKSGWIYYFFDDNDKEYEVWKYEDIFIVSEEEYEEYKKRKIEIRDKMKIIDPYSEEQWDLNERRIPYKKTLCQDLWENGQIIERIKNKLIKIARDFYEDIDFEAEIKDIQLTGSMANYNYSDESDIDVHIIINYADVNDDTNLVKKALDGQRFIWNLRHNIVIKDHDVEVYVQDEAKEHNSTGLYSLLNDKWIIKPSYNPPDVDTKDVNVKYDARVYDILRYERISKQDLMPDQSEEYYNNAKELKSKIMKARKEGLSEQGEFSIENLVFKKLRKEGKIKKLIDTISRFYDKIYSQ